MLLDDCNLQGRNKPHILEEPWSAIFLASHVWQIERFMAGAKMLMVSMNLFFPQTLSFLLRAEAGLSGSSWLLHPKFQLEFCCEISSVISSPLPRKAKHKRSGVWQKKLRLLTQRRSSKPELQLLSLKIRAHLCTEMLNPCWEVLLWPCCTSTWLPHSCKQLTKQVLNQLCSAHWMRALLLTVAEGV